MKSTSLQILAASAALTISCQAQPKPSAPPETEATLYSTMPSLAIHRPEMAMDGRESSYFQSAYGMNDGDDFTVLFSRPIPLNGLRISTGNPDGDNLLTKGFVELSADGKHYVRAATFDATGVARAKLKGQFVAALRIKINPGSGLPSLMIREIMLDSPAKVTYIGWGAGRAFTDYSVAPDLKEWATKADRQMNEFWPDAAALLYTDGFITPNKVNVIYRSGPNVTPVAATGGGEMTINVAWARAHPEDTGLAVHEMAHVVQSISAYNPVWLIEGTADYIRWVKFEPQNFKVNINPATSKYTDSYRTTGAFLAWCELNYDARIVSKLNRDTRFGTYSKDKFQQYCGKDVDTLWNEFVAAYKADPTGIITPPVAAADRPRALPIVAAGTSVSVDLSNSFNTVGITSDGARFGANNGFDGGGAAFSSSAIGTSISSRNVQFQVGSPDVNNVIAARGSLITLPPQKFASLWILGGAVEGAQRGQSFIVTYSDGSKQTLAQNLSDWFSPQSFAGESRAVKTAYRNMADGTRDSRPFSLYAYGFALDHSKIVQSLQLPDNSKLKIAALSLAN